MKTKLLLLGIFIIAGASIARAQWVQSPSPIQIWSFALFHGELLATGDTGIFRSTDNGISWSYLGLDTEEARTIVIRNNTIFVATLNAGVYASIDSGVTWEPDTAGMSMATEINALAQSDTTLLAATAKGIFISSQNGQRWHATGADSSFHVMTTSGKHVYAVLGSESFYYSSDEGSTWTRMGGLPAGTIFVYALAAVGNDLYDGSNSGIFRSTSDGASWEPASQGLPPSPFFTCPSFDVYGSVLFAGTNEGVFQSTDSGGTWIDDSARDAQGNPLTTMALLAWNGNLWAGTTENVWYRPLFQLVGSSGVNAIPSMTELQFNVYPNPVEHNLQISLTAKEGGVAELSIVNLLGNEIAHIYEGNLEAGNHSFSWDASNLPAGMYECILRMNGTAQEVSIVVTR